MGAEWYPCVGLGELEWVTPAGALGAKWVSSPYFYLLGLAVQLFSPLAPRRCSGWVGNIQHHEQKGLFMKPAGGLHPGGVETSQGSCPGTAKCG